MKKSLFVIVLVTLVAFAGSVFAQVQEPAKAVGQKEAKKTETKMEEPKAATEGKTAEVKQTTGEKPKHEAKPAEKQAPAKTTEVKAEAKHEAKPAEKKAPAKTTEVKPEAKKEAEKK